MTDHWTFNRKIAAGFAMAVLFAVVIGAVAVSALRSIVAANERLLSVNTQLLIDAARLDAALERKVSAGRGLLLSGEDRFVDQIREGRAELLAAVERLRRLAESDEGLRLIEAIVSTEQVHQQILERLAAQRRVMTMTSMDALVRAFDEQLAPRRDQFQASVRAFSTLQEQLMTRARQEAQANASSTIAFLAAAVAVLLVLAALVTYVLTRTLQRQIGTAVSHVQSSSAELQAAANQQATGAREQAIAMVQINTTIGELLATARQISESAQRVSEIAKQTLAAARTGDGTVVEANESVGAIRRQMDQVVSHMMELGKKSQQIGGVLDILSELAEQTNILAINATIEAAGAGDAGNRFAVVADEIRELADRVAGSTKEVRSLIEDVRGAVNTTVMATETGSKAVDTGSRQFAEVATAFRQIAGLVATTTDAAREIELSTKQQTSAVEQVNMAIANVAQATRETEVSSGQTLDTVSQLANLSRDLSRLVQAPATA